MAAATSATACSPEEHCLQQGGGGGCVGHHALFVLVHARACFGAQCLVLVRVHSCGPLTGDAGGLLGAGAQTLIALAHWSTGEQVPPGMPELTHLKHTPHPTQPHRSPVDRAAGHHLGDPREQAGHAHLRGALAGGAEHAADHDVTDRLRALREMCASCTFVPALHSHTSAGLHACSSVKHCLGQCDQ